MKNVNVQTPYCKGFNILKKTEKNKQTKVEEI